MLSRRGFLFGAGAAAVTVAAIPSALPALDFDAAVSRAVNLGEDVIFPLEYKGPFYFLYPSQWAMFESEGFNMNLCKLIEPIPTSTPRTSIWKVSDPVSHAL